MPSKFAMTSNVRYDETLRHHMCVIASERLSCLIALFLLSPAHQTGGGHTGGPRGGHGRPPGRR